MVPSRVNLQSIAAPRENGDPSWEVDSSPYTSTQSQLMTEQYKDILGLHKMLLMF